MDWLECFRRCPRWALTAWIILISAVVVRVAVAPPLSGTVVPIYLKAGERWCAGENIYAAFWPLDIYRNPPGVAAFFAPWSILPEKTAGILWRLLGVALYLSGLAAWLRDKPQSLGLVIFASAVLIIPSFNNGQVNVLIVGCLLLATANLNRERWLTAAAWVVFASFFKLYPLAVGLLFCAARPRFTFRLLPLFVLSMILPFAFQRPEYVWQMHRAFVDFLELEGRYRLMLDRPPWDWTIVPRVWLDIRVPAEITKLVSAFAGLIFAGLVAHVRRNQPEKVLVLAFHLGCIWMTLFGPATENSTYTLIAPTVALLLLNPHRASVWAVFVLVTLPILRGLFPSSDVLPFRTAQPIGTALLLGIVVQEVMITNQRKTKLKVCAVQHQRIDSIPVTIHGSLRTNSV